MRSIALAAVLWLFSSLLSPAQTFVLLETGADGKTSVIGDKALLKGAYPPASTFKLLIAWEALQEGIATPDTRHLCPDRGGREVGMTEAMYFSSNDYFRWLAQKLDRAKFEKLMQGCGWAGLDSKTSPPEAWRALGADEMERGGNLLVTVEQMHALTRQLMDLKPDRVSGDLRSVMRRPWDDPDSRVYGKTGSWGGAVWMTGYYDAVRPEERKAVTVYVPYVVPDWKPARTRALAEFYRCLGLPEPVSK